MSSRPRDRRALRAPGRRPVSCQAVAREPVYGLEPCPVRWPGQVRVKRRLDAATGRPNLTVCAKWSADAVGLEWAGSSAGSPVRYPATAEAGGRPARSLPPATLCLATLRAAARHAPCHGRPWQPRLLTFTKIVASSRRSPAWRPPGSGPPGGLTGPPQSSVHPPTARTPAPPWTPTARPGTGTRKEARGGGRRR